MTKFETGVNLCGSAVVTVCCALFGGWDLWMRTLLTVMVLDYATGVMGALVQGNLDSRVGFKGICKKLVMLGVVVLAVQADGIIGGGCALRSIAIGFYLANDALSIIENAALIGVPVPKRLVDKLEQLKESEKEGMEHGK